MQPWLERLTIALFAAALLAPTLDQLARPDEARDCRAAELRPPEPRPARPVTLEELVRFPRRYERHYLDTFGLRDVLLRWNNAEQWLGLGVLPAEGWFAGRDGWAFYAGPHCRDTHRGLRPFRPDELDGWVRRLRERRELLAARGARYLYVLCPNKQSVHGELAPPDWSVLGPTRREELAARLAAEGLPFLDLTAALRAARDTLAPGEHVYTPLGSHLGGRGSLVAARAILARLAEELPGIEVPLDSTFVARAGTTAGDGLVEQLYLDDLLVEPDTKFERAGGPLFRELERSGAHREGQRLRTRKELDAPRLLWTHDSFGPYLAPFLCESFSEVLALWTPRLTEEALAGFAPDVVLETYVERVLAQQTPYLPIAGLQDELAPRFERARRVLWRLGDARFTAPTAAGSAELRAGDTGLTVAIRAPLDGLLLSGLESPGGKLLVRVRVRCDAPLELELVLRGPLAPRFEPRNAARLRLSPEAPVALAELPFVGAPAELLLKPRLPATSVTLETLELRAP